MSNPWAEQIRETDERQARLIEQAVGKGGDAPAPTVHGYAAWPVQDALTLGVPGHGREDNATRDERATRIVDAADDLADRADETPLSLHPPEIPSVDIALLVHQHGGDLASTVNDPTFDQAARAHLGLTAGPRVVVSNRQVREQWVDPLEDPGTDRRFHREIDQGRETAGLEPLAEGTRGVGERAREAARGAFWLEMPIPSAWAEDGRAPLRAEPVIGGPGLAGARLTTTDDRSVWVDAPGSPGTETTTRCCGRTKGRNRSRARRPRRTWT